LAAALAGVLASGALAGGGAAPGRLVLSADRLPSVSGEIYRIGLDGTKTDLSNSPFADTQPVVSPDGKRAAFLSNRTGQSAVYVVGLDGRGLQRLSGSFYQVTIVGWSRDSRHVAMLTRGLPNSVNRLYVLAPGQKPRLIDSEPEVLRCALATPAWSPARSLLAYPACSGSGPVVRVVTADGRQVFSLSESAEATSLTWSPRGRLTVVSDRSVRVFDDRGRPLAHFAGDGLAWSRSGDRLASIAGGVLEVRDGDGGRVVLRKRLFAASLIRTIIARYRSYAPELLWVDNRRVAVGNVSLTTQTSVAPGETISRYATVNAGVDLATGRSWTPAQQAWFAGSCGCASPDGALLATTKSAGNSFALRVSRPDGSDARTIATIPGCLDDGGLIAAATAIQFANAGRSVVYQSTCYEPSANLYVLAAGRLQRLTQTNAQQTSPAWSPDGTRIVYSQAEAAGLSCRGCPETLWVMNADGSSPTALTTEAQSTWDQSPSWSPDGTQIVLSRATMDSYGQLLVVPAAGGPVRDLHTAGADPAWGPARIAYLDGIDIGGSHIQLKTIAPDGSDPRTLATGYLLSPAWSHDGRLAYLVQPPNGGGPDLAVIAGATTQTFPLGLAEARNVRWSADGTQLLVVGRVTANGPFDVFSIGADGHGFTRVTTNLDVLGADAG
jgi:TolB protein